MTRPTAFAAPVSLGTMFCAAKVRLREIEQVLRVRVRVDRREEALRDPPRVVQDFRDRGEAVRRARGVRDDDVFLRVVKLVVDAEDDRKVLVFAGGRDDALLRAALVDVRARLRRVGEAARRLDDDVDAVGFPRNKARLLFRRNRDRVAVDDDLPVFDFDRALIGAVGRVVLHQVGVRLRVDEVVDGDDLQLVAMALVDRLDDLAADAAEPVDSDLLAHG
jgi:hypothetical protein